MEDNSATLIDFNDSLSMIRSRNEVETIERQLKQQIGGGYTKSSVMQCITAMRADNAQMSENYQSMIKEIISEKEAISNERDILARQLEDALSMSKEAAAEKFGVDIDEMKSDLASAKSEAKEATDRAQAAESKAETLEGEKAELSEEAERLKLDYEKAREKIAAYESAMADEQSEENNIIAVREKNSQLTGELAEKAKMVEELTEKMAVLDAKLATVNQLKEENEQLQKELTEVGKSLRDASELSATQQNSAAEAKAAIEAEQQKTAAAVAEKTELQLRMVQYREQITALKTENSELTEKMAAARSALEAAKKELFAKDEQIAGLENSINTFKAENDELKASITQYQETVKSLEKENEEWKASIASLSGRIAEQDTALAASQDKIDLLQKTVDDFDAMIKKNELEIEELTRKDVESAAQIERLENENKGALLDIAAREERINDAVNALKERQNLLKKRELLLSQREQMLEEREGDFSLDDLTIPVKEEKAAATTKICPNCGKELPLKALFCGGCGSKLSE